MAVCALRCIDQNNDTLKILGTLFSYNEKLKEEKSFYKTVTDIQRVLNTWKMRKIILEGKIAIFKTTAILKIVFQSFIATVPKHIMNKLEKIQKAFLWKNSTSKIKHETLCNDYKAGGLKKGDIPTKILALQCSLIRRLYDNSFHEWKLILLYFIENRLADHLNFIQIYYLRVIKQSFSHFSIENFFCAGKNTLL